MNENTKEKTENTIKEICGDLERIAKKTLIFNASIQAMQQSDCFKKFDYELQFMDIETMLRLTAERVAEALKEYKAED
jgi:hypothetical protein